MAEGLLKKMISGKAGQGIKITSAGIAAIDGFGPTDNAVKVMKKESVDITGHKTRKLSAHMLKDADLILVMEEIHRLEAIRLGGGTAMPEVQDKIYLLREYTNKKDGLLGFSVPDPIGRPLEVYEKVSYMIKGSLEELVRKI